MSQLDLSPQEMSKLNNAVRECADSMAREQQEKDYRKDVAQNLKEELDMKPATFNALVNERYKEKFTNDMAKAQEIVDLNEELLEIQRKEPSEESN